MVEGRGPDHLAEREFDLERLEVILERNQLLAARRLVVAVHDRRLLRLQRLGRRHVGRDHVILDQLVRIEPLARRHRQNAPLFVEHHPALRQIEVERPPLLPSREHRLPASPKGFQGPFDDLRRDRRRLLQLRHRAGGGGDLHLILIHRRLRVFVSNIHGDSHSRTGEAPALQLPVLRHLQVADQRRAILALDQRADMRRQRLGQHRNHAIREIDAVAALPRLLVQSGARADVEADVGDRDDRLPAAGILEIVVGRRPDGVVMIARVGGVDCDNGHVGQILARA